MCISAATPADTWPPAHLIFRCRPDISNGLHLFSLFFQFFICSYYPPKIISWYVCYLRNEFECSRCQCEIYQQQLYQKQLPSMALTHREYFPLKYIKTNTEIYIWLKNAIFDKERRAITYADRRTTWYIWTSLHRKNHCSWTPDKRHQRYVQKSWPRNAPYIHTKYQTICPSSTAWGSATQKKYHSKLESNLDLRSSSSIDLERRDEGNSAAFSSLKSLLCYYNESFL